MYSVDNSSTQTVLSPSVGIMTLEEYTLATLIRASFGMVMACAGITANAVCIRVFLAMKNGDGVTIGFLGLACSDLTQSVSALGMHLSSALEFFERTYGHLFKVDAFMLTVFYVNISLCVNEVTILVTTYLALARCVCIALPFQFRNNTMFTPNQTRLFIISAWAFAVGVTIPILANMGSRQVFSPILNTTRHVIWFSSDREQIKDVVIMVTQMIIPFSSQAIILICIGIMARKLHGASSFRQGAMSEAKSPTHDVQISGKPDTDSKDNSAKTSVSGKLSGKELQVVKQVAIISTIFVVCNIPMILMALLGVAVPGFDISSGSDRFKLLYITMHGYKRLLEQVNASVNVLVYYRFNSRFREYLKGC